MTILPGDLIGAPLAVDRRGDLLVADAVRRDVRIIPAASGALFGRRVRAGFIYRVTGNGLNGPLGDGGLATSARLENYAPGIEGVAVDGPADALHWRVRVVAAWDGKFVQMNARRRGRK